MNADETALLVAWTRLRDPFELDEIELLPKYTGQKDSNGNVPASAKKDCPECGGYHGFPCVHLSYVGHAGITMRLNAVDRDWNWEPVATTPEGLPLIHNGSLWIKLTVLGKTVLAVGDAQGKSGPNAVKEIIGDAIRNGAMRFGCGTYLWSKSDKAKAELTRQGVEDDEPAPEPPAKPARKITQPALKRVRELRESLGISDSTYLAQLAWAQGEEIGSDEELTVEAGRRLIEALEAKS